MSNAARNAILNKLRSANDKSAVPPITVPAYDWPEIDSPLAQFVSLLEANHADVIQVTENEVPVVVGEQLAKHSANNPVASDVYISQFGNADGAINGLPEGSIEQWKDLIFDDIDVGITTAHCAIATTGTIVLWPGPGEPRTLSLVPPVHIVIVRTDTLYNDFAAVMREQKWAEAMPTNLLLVSGPSKTADIQQTLAYGAHGPRELVVVLVK